MFTLVSFLFTRATNSAIVAREDENERAIADNITTGEEQINNEEELCEQEEDTSHRTRNDGHTDETDDFTFNESENENVSNHCNDAPESGSIEDTSEPLSPCQLLPHSSEVLDQRGARLRTVQGPERAPSKAILFVFESWHADSDRADTQPSQKKMIEKFCDEKKFSTELRIYAIVFSHKLSEKHKRNAKSAGITLIPVNLNLEKKSCSEQGEVNLSVYEKHCPSLTKLQNVCFVIGHHPTTTEEAAKIQCCLFPDAELELIGAPAALFVFTDWNKDHLGLQQFHRTLVLDFCARKGKIKLKAKTEEEVQIREEVKGERGEKTETGKKKLAKMEWKANMGKMLRVYSTLLDVEVSDGQKKDAEKYGVTLIPARRKSRALPEEDPESLDWLLYHEGHYPDLKHLVKVHFVVGYAPKTGNAAADIRETLFPDAKLFLINHRYLDDSHKLSDPTELNKLKKQMLELAKDADLMVSLGPDMYSHYDNEYRALSNSDETKYKSEYRALLASEEIELQSVPHIELIPKPRTGFLDEEIEAKRAAKVGKRVILSYGKMNTKMFDICKQLESHIGKVQEYRKELQAYPTVWRVLFFSETPSKADVTPNFSGMKLVPYQCCFADELMIHLKQAHVCIAAPFDEDYDFNGLEATAMGLPLLVDGDSQLAKLLDKYFKIEGEHCLVQSPEEWSKKIHRILNETSTKTAFEKAEILKAAYKTRDVVDEGYTEFAAMFSFDETQNLQDLPVTIYLEGMKREDIEDIFKSHVAVVVESRRQEVIIIVKRLLRDVIVEDLSQGSLVITLRFLSLLGLYRFKASCKWRCLTRALQPVLISNELRNKAAAAGEDLRLEASYDQDKFREIQLFFLNRDGGEIKPVEINDEIGEGAPEREEVRQRLLEQFQLEDELYEEEVNIQIQEECTVNEVSFQEKAVTTERSEDSASETHINLTEPDEYNTSRLTILKTRLEKELAKSSILQHQCDLLRETAERAEKQAAMTVMRMQYLEEKLTRPRREIEQLHREKSDEATEKRVHLGVDKLNVAEETESQEDFASLHELKEINLMPRKHQQDKSLLSKEDGRPYSKSPSAATEKMIKTREVDQDTQGIVTFALPEETEVKTAEELNELKVELQQLQNLLKRMDKAIGMLPNRDYEAKEQACRIQTLESTSYTGTLMWKISDFNRKLRDAVDGKVTSFCSAAFYTGRYGYKLCSRIYLNGNCSGRGNHISLFVVIMKGVYDKSLFWPFEKEIEFTWFDQSMGKHHMTKSLRPDPTSLSSSRPDDRMSNEIGFPLFLPLSELDNPRRAYVKDDVAFIKICIES